MRTVFKMVVLLSRSISSRARRDTTPRLASFATCVTPSIAIRRTPQGAIAGLDHTVVAQDVHQRLKALCPIGPEIDVRRRDLRDMEVQNDLDLVAEQARPVPGHQVALPVEGDDGISDGDLLDGFLPDRGAHGVLVVKTVGVGRKTKVQRPHIEGRSGGEALWPRFVGRTEAGKDLPTVLDHRGIKRFHPMLCGLVSSRGRPIHEAE